VILFMCRNLKRYFLCYNEAMKIGIDARMLGEKQTGIGLYTKHLIEHLAKLDTQNEYVLFLRKKQFKKFEVSNKSFKKVLADSKWYSFSEQIKFLFNIYSHNVDCMHFPSFNAPLFYFGRRITTIHDLTPKYFPGHKMNSFFRRFAFKLVFSRSIYASEKIIAVSEYTKNEILKYYKIDEEKIEVIYGGIPNKNRNESFDLSDEEFLKKYDIKKPYIFYTGVWRNHKNLVGLIKAFKVLREKYKKDFCLVLGGKEDKFYPEVRQTWEDLNLDDEVIIPGFIKSEEMGLFLKNAEVFVLPSFVEGFGLGPLEALSYKTPAAVSDSGSLPEALGRAGVYFNPDDPEDIAKKINLVLDDKSLRERLLKEGEEAIKKYNWEECAQKTLDLYNTI